VKSYADHSQVEALFSAPALIMVKRARPWPGQCVHSGSKREAKISMRRLMVLVLCGLAAGAARAEEGGHRHAAPPPAACSEPGLSCARSATPAFAADGTLWLAWSAGGRVYVSPSPDAGKSFGAPVPVPGEPATIDDNGEARITLAALPDGELAVGYAVRRDQHYNGQAMVSRSTGHGRSFSAPQALLDGIGQRFETLAAAPGGRLYVAWLDRRNKQAAEAAGQPYADTGVAVAWSDDGGASFAGKRILADHSCDCCRLAMAMDPDGLPVLAWRHVFAPNLRDHAAARLMADGTLSAPARISEDQWAIDACPRHGPSLAVDEAGAWHVAWYTAGKRRQGLFYARSDDGGRSFSEPMAVGAPERAPSRPQVLSAGKRLVLAWKEFDGAATTVMAQESRDGGRSWGAARAVAATSGESDHPQLIGQNGRAFLSWLSRAEGYRLLPLEAAP
jgi:hypothetical protein